MTREERFIAAVQVGTTIYCITKAMELNVPKGIGPALYSTGILGAAHDAVATLPTDADPEESASKFLEFQFTENREQLGSAFDWLKETDWTDDSEHKL